jgi:aspartyl-tRNA synthetase
MSWPARSHGAGTVTEADVGQEITVCGWVDRNRNLGGLGFMDVRDHTGLLQVGVVITRGQAADAFPPISCERHHSSICSPPMLQVSGCAHCLLCCIASQRL